MSLNVNNELKAPETPMGHGDAFFSISMALMAAHESKAYSMSVLGNVQEWASDILGETSQSPSLDQAQNSSLVDFKDSAINADLDMSDCPNPNCADDLCRPSFWVPANKLCLKCNYRG